MRTSIQEDRLLVVSDIHMGNLLHRPRRAFSQFVQFAFENRYSVCLNGDGIDIAQLSMSQLNADLSPSLPLLSRFGSVGCSVYYTVGNHDIALEHFLSDVGGMQVVPFLNVRSGEKRIRVEHGHMYDEMFLKYPWIYFQIMNLGKLAIAISPGVYDAMHRVTAGVVGTVEAVPRFFRRKFGSEEVGEAPGIPGERECFGLAAQSVGLRGFDVVTFGHTHMPGTVEFEFGTTYFNTGAWFAGPWCLAINRGNTWFGPVADLTEDGDPFPMDEGDATGEVRS